MIGTLYEKAPIRAWLVKQIDDDILHLCGQGAPAPQGKPERPSSSGSVRAACVWAILASCSMRGASRRWCLTITFACWKVAARQNGEAAAGPFLSLRCPSAAGRMKVA